jgi:hypothetical protein
MAAGTRPSRPRRHAGPRSRRARRCAIALAAVGALLLGACSGAVDDGDAGPEPGAAPSSAAPGEPPPLATRSSFGEVTGRLPQEVRQRLRERVTEAVDAWIDAAYVAGDYPRSDFADAFDQFTPGVRRVAERDRALLSNAELGESLDGVEALRREVRLDVLAVDRRAVGVTARIRLDLRLSGDVERTRERVAGELYLTWQGADGWQVFGYDLTRGPQADQARSEGGRS